MHRPKRSRARTLRHALDFLRRHGAHGVDARVDHQRYGLAAARRGVADEAPRVLVGDARVPAADLAHAAAVRRALVRRCTAAWCSGVLTEGGGDEMSLGIHASVAQGDGRTSLPGTTLKAKLGLNQYWDPGRGVRDCAAVDTRVHTVRV